MLKDPEKNAKAELNKHINSKLFQKFLTKEAAKISDTVHKPSPKPIVKNSPLRSRRIELDLNPEDRARSLSRGLNKTVSHRSSLKNIREISPVLKKDSPLLRTKKYELDISEVHKSHFDSPGIKRTKLNPEEPQNYVQVYTVDPLLVKQLESEKKSLQDELKKTVDKYELLIRKKTEEFKRLLKQNEHLKIVNEELQGKLDQAEEAERRAGILKTEKDLLERKVHNVESECENQKRQVKHLKESCDNYKKQVDEFERISRSKTHDVERELRLVKDRNDDLDRQLSREKERQQDAERKVVKSKERVFALESELSRSEDRTKKLERDLQEAKDRLTHEANHQLRETEGLRRKIEELTQEILNKEKKEEYQKKRVAEGREQELYNTVREGRRVGFGEEEPNGRRGFGESLGPYGRRDVRDRGREAWNKDAVDKKRMDEETVQMQYAGRRYQRN